MQPIPATIRIDNEPHEAEVLVYNLRFGKRNGKRVVYDYDVEIVQIDGIPAKCFDKATLEDARSQCYEDYWVQADVARMAREDEIGNRMDAHHGREREAI